MRIVEKSRGTPTNSVKDYSGAETLWRDTKSADQLTDRLDRLHVFFSVLPQKNEN